MILVLDDEVKPDYRYLGPEIARILPESDYHVYVNDAETPLETSADLGTRPLEDYDGVVVSGSTASVYDPDHPWIESQIDLVRECIEREIPLLGICFGHQLINYGLGGRVEKDRRRATFVEMTERADDPVLAGVEPIVPVLHADLVLEPGEGMESIAATDYSEFFCTRHVDAPVWTVQFHPEFTERVEDRPSDWDRGGHSFEDCTATRVLTNFASVCETR